MIPKASTCREKPARSVNITAHSSPKRSQMRWSMRARSASERGGEPSAASVPSLAAYESATA